MRFPGPDHPAGGPRWERDSRESHRPRLSAAQGRGGLRGAVCPLASPEPWATGRPPGNLRGTSPISSPMRFNVKAGRAPLTPSRNYCERVPVAGAARARPRASVGAVAGRDQGGQGPVDWAVRRWRRSSAGGVETAGGRSTSLKNSWAADPEQSASFAGRRRASVVLDTHVHAGVCRTEGLARDCGPGGCRQARREADLNVGRPDHADRRRARENGPPPAIKHVSETSSAGGDPWQTSIEFGAVDDGFTGEVG